MKPEAIFLKKNNPFKRVFYTALIIISYLLVISSSKAQDEYKFEILPIGAAKVGINDKLSQGRVSNIAEDERGLIWIGTLDGLNRYDGYKVKVFKHQINDTTTIDNNRIVKILNAPDGHLWILTKTGINKFDPYTEISSLIQFPEHFNDVYEINDIVLDKTQNLWIARTDGLYVLKNKSETIERLELDVYFEKVFRLEVDYLNNIWIGSNKNYLTRYNHRLKSIKTFIYPGMDSSFDNFQVFDMHQDEDLNLWIAIHGEDESKICNPNIYLLEKGSNHIRIFDDYIPVLTENGHETLLSTARSFASRKGELFISAISAGLVRIKHKTKTITYMPEYMEFNWYTEIDKNDLFFDSNGDLWLGGNGEGVFILPLKQDLFSIVRQDIQKEFEIKSIRSFYELGDYIYIGGYSGLVKMHKTTGKITKIDLTTVVYCIESFPNDPRCLLIGSEGEGLMRFDSQTNKIELLNQKWKSGDGYKIPWMWIFDLYKDGDSLYWGGAKDGIFKYSVSDGKVDLFLGEDYSELKLGSIFSIYRDFNGVLFAGGDGSGLLVFDEKHQRFKKYTNQKFPSFDFQSFRFNHITQSKDSTYWFSTDGGLISMNDEDIKIFSKKDGLLNDFVYATIPDNNDRLWMSTNDGVFRYDRKNKQMTSFSVFDRLQGQEFNTGAHYKSKDGIIYFGGVNGFNYFDPDKISQQKEEIPIKVIGFYLNNQEQKLGKQQFLKKTYYVPPDIEYFKLDFAALKYPAIQQFRYKYKMNELHSNWIGLNHKNEISFHSLAPGKYTLEILAADRNGSWNLKPYNLTIIVESYFWETRLFIYGSIILFIVFILIVLNYRYFLLKQQKYEIENTVQERTMELSVVNKRLKKANETKDKFLTIISHDIKNPLSAAQSISHDLLENEANYTKKEKGTLLSILNRSMEHLQTLLENLRNWSKLQNHEIKPEFDTCDIKEIVQDNIKLFSASLLKKRIEINEVIDNGSFVNADCKMIDAIIRNLISNAIKFSNTDSVINIVVQNKYDFVEIQIEDNGVGMTEEQVNNIFIPGLCQSLPGTENEQGTGFGLLMVYEFVKLNKGKIDVVSEPDYGTSFILTFPAQKKKLFSGI